MENLTSIEHYYIHPKIDRGYVVFKGKIKKRKNYHYNLYYDLFKINDASKKIELILQRALSNKSKRKKASVGGKYYSEKTAGPLSILEQSTFGITKLIVTIFTNNNRKNPAGEIAR